MQPRTVVTDNWLIGANDSHLKTTMGMEVLRKGFLYNQRLFVQTGKIKDVFTIVPDPIAGVVMIPIENHQGEEKPTNVS